MLKNYNRLWVFGDSFSTPNYCVDPKDSFWGLAAKHLGVNQIINCSWPGNSFASVCHMLISCQPQYNWESDFFLIGIPPLERITVFDNHRDTAQYGYKFNTEDWNNEKFEVDCHHGLQNLQLASEKKLLVAFEDRSWTEVLAMQTVFLLNAWLDSMKANYLIVNLGRAFDVNNIWRPSEFLLPTVSSHNKNVIFQDTYISVNENINKPVDFDRYGWLGHHGPAGNHHYFETSLKDKFC